VAAEADMIRFVLLLVLIDTAVLALIGAVILLISAAFSFLTGWGY
jgi:hypothetical protein